MPTYNRVISKTKLRELEAGMHIKGWLHDQYEAGKRPDCRERLGSLPEVPEGTCMRVKTMFELARENEKRK